MALYDSIGQGYRNLRQQDPRIAAPILRALDGADSIVNVGAGAGSYEPRDRNVVAVEPSMVMIRQRAAGSPPAVQATATHLPFADASFDAALATLTIHHWPDLAKGLGEMRRVARHKVVLLTYDLSVEGFWLTDYFPEILEIDRKSMPSLEKLCAHLGPIEATPVPVPHDCTDGFYGAYWRRPEAYLDANVRAAISLFSKISNVEAGVAALKEDLESGVWEGKYGGLLSKSELHVGYCLAEAKAAS